jgi:predicted dehydrogenase
MINQQIKVGLIGYGIAGRVFHAPVINAVPDFKLTKVVERHREESRQRYPWVEIARDASELFLDEEIELVVIATPNATHFELARQALLANKHVVVDKPFTATSAEADQLIDLARKQNRIVTAFQNRRWDGDFQTVKKLIESGMLGRLAEYESHFDRFRNYIRAEAWREEEAPGNGLTYDLGTHLVDQAQVLFGLPRSVTADIRTQRDGAMVDDNFELILDYGSLKVTLKAGVLVREQNPRFILHGTEGSFIKYGLDPQEDALKLGRTPTEADWGKEPKDQWGSLLTTMSGLYFEGRVETLAGNYMGFYQNIADAIRGRAELIVKPEEARNTIRIIELAFQSNREKRTVSL